MDIAIALNNFARTKKNVLEMLRVGTTCAKLNFVEAPLFQAGKKINRDVMEEGEKIERK